MKIKQEYRHLRPYDNKKCLGEDEEDFIHFLYYHRWWSKRQIKETIVPWSMDRERGIRLILAKRHKCNPAMLSRDGKIKNGSV